MSAKLVPIRVQGRKRAAEIFHAVMKRVIGEGHDECNTRSLGRRFQISHTEFADRADGTSGLAPNTGDVLAYPKALAIDYLVALLCEVLDGRPADTRETFDRLFIELGHALDAYRRDLADGREDEREVHQRNLRKILAIAVRGVGPVRGEDLGR